VGDAFFVRLHSDQMIDFVQIDQRGLRLVVVVAPFDVLSRDMVFDGGLRTI
jgi:hypothetical protein